MPSVTAALLSALMLTACGATTKIPSAWRNPAHQGAPYQKVFVIGVGENDANRRLFEDRFAAALSGEEGNALPSYGALPQSQQLSEAEIRGAIRGGGFDGVVITQLIAVDEKTEYVPPRTHTQPGYVREYHDYYGYSWEVAHRAGYYQTHTIVRLETNLYDVGTGDLVWSGQSETLNPSSTTDIIDSVTKAVAKRLREESLIP